MLFSAFTAAVASAATIYVPEGGNQTIQQAVNNATAGDTIIVRDGTYNENVDVTKSHLTIRSENGPSVTTVSASLYPNKHVFNITDQTNVTLKGFEIRDAHGTSQSVAGIYMNNASECNISNNIVTNISTTGYNCAYGIYLDSSSGNSFYTSTVYNISAYYSASGIWLDSSSDNSFYTSTVYNLSGYQYIASGIWLDSSSDNSFYTTSVYNLSAADGFASGIWLYHSSDNNSFYASTTVYNLSADIAYGIYLSSSRDNSFVTSTVYNLSADIAYGLAYGIYLSSSRDNSFVTSTVYNLSADSQAFGILLSSSSDNSFYTSTVYNLSSANGQAFGILLDSSSDNNSFYASTTVYNLSADSQARGIRLCSSSDNNSFYTSTVYNLSADDQADGILLSSSSDNSFYTSTVYNLSANWAQCIWLGFSSDNNSFYTSTVYNLSANIAVGIDLSSSSDNSFSSGSISDINAPTWWDFYSNPSSHGNSAEDITISSFPTTISFTYENGIGLKSVETQPADPAGKRNISKYVNVTNVTADSWIFMNVSYEEGDLDSVDENSLRMWKHNGTDWTLVPGTNGVNTAENYVYANITEFSIFAPLGSTPAAGLNCTCGDICVNTTGWWRDGGAFNASNTPIQYAIDNATAENTICVKDGTYTENVDVNVAHLTVKSENGSASTIVQAANSNDHVFEVTEAYVNISGFKVTGATGAYTAGIYLGSGVTHGNIFDNIASNNTFGIHLWESSTNTLSDNTAFENDDSGIQLSFYSSYNSLSDNTACDNGGSGIGLWNHSSYNSLSDNTASDNEIGVQLSLLSNSNSLRNNTAFNNTISDEDGIGISISASSYNDIEGGNVYYNDIGISIESEMPESYNNVTGVNVTDNGIGIELMGEENCIIANNVIRDNTEKGIYIDFSNRNNISGNTITGNDRGIYLHSSCYNEITNNNVSYNNVNGVELGPFTSSSYNNISNNIIDHNGQYGIYFHYYEEYNTIFNNTISNNTCGIFIDNADNNNITDNFIVNNQQYGIYLTSSYSNTIYNNYFNNTNNNAWDDGNNVWNVTKRAGTSIIGGPYLGGNYWSDYAGKDSTGDGLGDNLLPYNSSENITNGGDWHPLVPVKLCGDVAPHPDCNGVVDMGDVILLLNHVGYPGNSTYALCNDWSGDCRCNGIINMGDVILLLNNVSYLEGDPKYALACC